MSVVTFLVCQLKVIGPVLDGDNKNMPRRYCVAVEDDVHGAEALTQHRTEAAVIHPASLPHVFHPRLDVDDERAVNGGNEALLIIGM